MAGMVSGRAVELVDRTHEPAANTATANPAREPDKGSQNGHEPGGDGEERLELGHSMNRTR